MICALIHEPRRTVYEKQSYPTLHLKWIFKIAHWCLNRSPLKSCLHSLCFQTIPLQPVRLQKRCGTTLRQKSVRKNELKPPVLVTGTRAWFCTSPRCLHRHLLQCCFPCCWSCCFNWISFFLTTNDTFESKDICKDFPLKGRDWFHVQRRLLQKPAVSYKDLKPCRVLVTPGTFRKFYHPRK